MRKTFQIIVSAKSQFYENCEKGINHYISKIKVIRNEKTFYNVVSAKSQFPENC